MTVRKRRWTDKHGRVREKWMVHIEYTHPDGRRKPIRKISPVNTRRGAEEYERQLRAELLAGTYEKEPPKPTPTFIQFAAEFVESYAKVNTKPSSVRSTTSILEHHLRPFFGKHKLDEISLRGIERYKAKKLEAGLSKKSINNHLGVLGKMLRVAHEWELLPALPKIKLLKAPKPDFRFLDFEEAERLVQAARSEPLWQTMIVVALNTGLRVGELLALQWDDLDLRRGEMHVRRSVVEGHIGTPKSGKSRKIPLNDKAVRVLKAHMHLRSKLVFCKEDGSMLTDGQIKCPLYRIRRRAGIVDVAWHDLRHTFASHLVMGGVPLKAIQELLGHSTIEVTMRYAHFSPVGLKAAVAALDRPSSTPTAQEPAASREPALSMVSATKN